MTEKYPVYEYKINQINKLYMAVFKNWCDKNCNGLWRLSYITLVDNDVCVFVTFIEKEDAMKFRLRWM